MCKSGVNREFREYILAVSLASASEEHRPAQAQAGAPTTTANSSVTLSQIPTCSNPTIRTPEFEFQTPSERSPLIMINQDPGHSRESELVLTPGEVKKGNSDFSKDSEKREQLFSPDLTGQ
jgi:hypothetical protein